MFEPSTNSHRDHPALPMQRTIAVVNQKGGVGKTTTAVNLATALAAIDRRVLLLDLDAQGNASTGLGIERAARKLSCYEVLIGEVSIHEALMETSIPGMSIVPSTIDLAGADLELADLPRRAERLKEAVEAFWAAEDAATGEDDEEGKGFDHILIDCPPSLSLVTLNAMVAAASVLVPLQCEFYALEGLSTLLQTIERVRHNFNPKLAIQGVVLTMHDRRTNLSDDVEEDVRSFLGDKVYNTVIPRNVRISEAPSHGKPALLYDYTCPGSQAYIMLAREMLQRDRNLEAA